MTNVITDSLFFRFAYLSIWLVACHLISDKFIVWFSLKCTVWAEAQAKLLGKNWDHKELAIHGLIVAYGTTTKILLFFLVVSLIERFL